MPFGIVPLVTVSTVPPRSATTRGLRGLAGLPLNPDRGERRQNEHGSKGQKYISADHENLQVKA